MYSFTSSKMRQQMQRCQQLALQVGITQRRQQARSAAHWDVASWCCCRSWTLTRRHTGEQQPTTLSKSTVVSQLKSVPFLSPQKHGYLYWPPCLPGLHGGSSQAAAEGQHKTSTKSIHQASLRFTVHLWASLRCTTQQQCVLEPMNRAVVLVWLLLRSE